MYIDDRPSSVSRQTAHCPSFHLDVVVSIGVSCIVSGLMRLQRLKRLTYTEREAEYESLRHQAVALPKWSYEPPRHRSSS